MSKYEVGKVVKGTVTGITNYGIFLSLDEYYSGLIHISEISHGYVKDVNNFVKIGETIYVEVLEVDESEQHTKLSIKNINYRIEFPLGKKRKIVETPLGFRTLARKLPQWVEESLKKIQNVPNSIDK